MKILILFFLFSSSAIANEWEFTVDLSAGQSITRADESYYNDDYVGIVNVDAAYYVSEHIAGLVGFQHISKLKRDTCNNGYCAGDNLGRIGIRFKW